MATTRSPSKEGTPKEFSITDLTLAAYLSMCGHKATMERRGNTTKGYPIGGWVFESTPELEKRVLEYNQGKVTVEPRDFHNALSNTRSRLLDFLGVQKR
jgi:hypothetical protein